jgi:ribosome-binding protein aMBF1 (putative translation factor)
MIPCEVCGEEFASAIKVITDDEIFICCPDCKKQIDDFNTANSIGTSLKAIIDAAAKKKNDLQ